MSTAYAENRRFLEQQRSRLGWIEKLRPMALQALLLRWAAPGERRRVVETASGLRLFVDPFNHLGRNILLHDAYEPDMADVMSARLQPG